MWLFTKYGFFSIVKKKFNVSDPSFQVRTREKRDLENIIRLTDMSEEIIITPHADYKYRIVVTKEQLETIMKLLLDSLDYENFKSKVHTMKDQKNKLHAYYKVWEAMCYVRN